MCFAHDGMVASINIIIVVGGEEVPISSSEKWTASGLHHCSNVVYLVF